MIKTNYTCIRYPDLNLKMRDGVKLRGYFANKYAFDDIMHNHGNSGTIYRYPLIQYKVIDNIPALIGLNNGATIIMRIGMSEDEIVIEDTHFNLERAEIISTNVDFGLSENYHEYHFKTPWFCLNQNNIEDYKNSTETGKKSLLNTILIGNILSMSKGLNYWVEDKLIVDTNVTEIPINFKGKSMLAFKGSFVTNFQIPDYLGLGKSVSRGFGTVRRYSL